MRFIKPDGTTIDSSVPTHSGDWTQLPLQHGERGTHIYAATAATRWAGEKCDYGLGVEVLLAQARKARAASHVEQAEVVVTANALDRPVVADIDDFDAAPVGSLARWRKALADVTRDSRSTA